MPERLRGGEVTENIRSVTRNPLGRYGWTVTRAGRYIDPVTKRSYLAREAWDIVNERMLAELATKTEADAEK